MKSILTIFFHRRAYFWDHIFILWNFDSNIKIFFFYKIIEQIHKRFLIVEILMDFKRKLWLLTLFDEILTFFDKIQNIIFKILRMTFQKIPHWSSWLFLFDYMHLRKLNIIYPLSDPFVPVHPILAVEIYTTKLHSQIFVISYGAARK